MKVLVIAHDPLSTAGHLAEIMRRWGFELRQHVVCPDPSQTTRFNDFPIADEYDLVVLTGAVWSVYDVARIPWVTAEIDLASRALRRGQYIIGICFGAQLLAALLGADVRRAPELTFGWKYLSWVGDESLAKGPWFHWHQDHFTLPRLAIPLGQLNDLCSAFTIERALAVQFHPEASSSLVNSWIAQEEQSYFDSHDLTAKDLAFDNAELFALANNNAEQLLAWYLRYAV